MPLTSRESNLLPRGKGRRLASAGLLPAFARVDQEAARQDRATMWMGGSRKGADVAVEKGCDLLYNTQMNCG
jgi:hypothetical protein